GLVMQHGRPGRRYLLGNENLTLRDLFTRLSELTGVPVPRWRVPYPVGLAVAWVSEFAADSLTGRPPIATITGIRLARRIIHFDSSRSLAELGLQPRRIHESLADAISWLRLSGQLPSRAATGPSPKPMGAGSNPVVR